MWITVQIKYNWSNSLKNSIECRLNSLVALSNRRNIAWHIASDWDSTVLKQRFVILLFYLNVQIDIICNVHCDLLVIHINFLYAMLSIRAHFDAQLSANTAVFVCVSVYVCVAIITIWSKTASSACSYSLQGNSWLFTANTKMTKAHSNTLLKHYSIARYGYVFVVISLLLFLVFDRVQVKNRQRNQIASKLLYKLHPMLFVLIFLFYTLHVVLLDGLTTAWLWYC